MSTTQYAASAADAIANDPCPIRADTLRELAREPRDALILPRPGPWGASAVIKYPPGRRIPMPADVREAADLGPLDTVREPERQVKVYCGDMVIVVDTVILPTPASTSKRERIGLYVHGRPNAVPVDAVDPAKIRDAIVAGRLELPSEILDGEGRPAHVARVMHVLRAGYGLSDLMAECADGRRPTYRLG